MDDELTAEQVYKFDRFFTNIYDDAGGMVNPLPDNEKLTVWCSNGEDEEGYAINKTIEEVGLNAFIAKKWILHSELEKLLKTNNTNY